ncbi:MFS transporter [Pelomicrobium methylotrophicum]|uniref:MFS transporter n=1 Tax=Pelomicrobium methylotrophicum TaxID=2602750 RepID=A0A5C7EKI0_9PROT|nr:MFS transporter [Pelomicrobium methylotrophicum]TXF13081.1 MFS transporter [Pelomicrobium methylotrophicum]
MQSPARHFTALERRATFGLASVYGLRMLGLFIILPVFALYAESLPGGRNPTLVGLALGVYGLTQALLQIPFGWLSDRIGRKPVIYLGLVLFAAGSFVAAAAPNVQWVIAGRALQGAGAISAAVMALAADLTREERRTQAMAVIGVSIGAAFALSLIVSAPLSRLIGVPGIFALTGVLALAAMGVVAWLVPTPGQSRFHSDAEARLGLVAAVAREPQLVRLNFGVFALHAVLMALWVAVPFALRRAGLAADHHWQVYLPVLLGSVLLMVPAIVYAERRAKLKQVFICAIVALVVAEATLALAGDSVLGVAAALLAFFAGFNILEASLPSLISKVAPVAAKGTAIGIYSSVQFLGTFAGGAAGGFLYGHYGAYALYGFCAMLLLAWLGVAAGMRQPPAVRTHMYPVPAMDQQKARGLAEQLARLPGVREALVLAAEGVAYIKADADGFDEQRALRLIGEMA